MRRKLFTIILASSLAISSSAFVYADEKDDRIKELENQIETLEETISKLQTELQNYKDSSSSKSSLDDLEKYLIEKKVLSGDRTEMAAEMVGAISGLKYGNSEFYEYDTSSENYKTLSSGGSIVLEGFGLSLTPLAINNEFVMFGEASDELVTAFNEYKQP